MKLIKAIIREERIPFVQRALAAHGVSGMTVYPVLGRGDQGGIQLQYRGGVLNIDLLPKAAMVIVIRNEMEDLVVSTILDSAKTGKPGDGKIFVIPVEGSHRVRTGEVEA
jgi:nitrogen regulatory protein P-II 1